LGGGTIVSVRGRKAALILVLANHATNLTVHDDESADFAFVSTYQTEDMADVGTSM
jgi:hypothetical protein